MWVPFIPCELDGCDRLADTLVAFGDEVLACACYEHQWMFMRRVAKRVKKLRPLEAESGWLKFCEGHGYDPLATTWRGANAARVKR